MGVDREEENGAYKGQMGGCQSPRVFLGAVIGMRLKYVSVRVCARRLAAEGQGGHKVAALHCWHVVHICSLFWKLITATLLSVEAFVVCKRYLNKFQ